MKVSELIARLQAMPPEAEVGYYWDSAARSVVDHVWLTRDGRVLVADDDETIETRDRPEGVPSWEQDPSWRPS